jgi:hypothetical protein
MSSTVQASYTSAISVLETLTGPFVDPGNPDFSVSGLSESGALNAASVPPASMQSSGQIALISGAVTMDLTALKDSEGNAISFNGLKVQLAKFRNPAANANPISLTFGAATPYNLLGATWQITLAPGESFLFVSGGGTPTVTTMLKNIDITGTGTQALDYHLVAG